MTSPFRRLPCVIALCGVLVLRRQRGPAQRGAAVERDRRAHVDVADSGAQSIPPGDGAAGHAITLTFTVPVIGATTLKYTKFQDISNNIDAARIHGGMHFRFDQVAGVRLGREVATYVYKNSLQPIHP